MYRASSADRLRRCAAADEKCCGAGNEIVKVCYRTAFHIPCAGDGMYCCPITSRAEAPDEEASKDVTFTEAPAVKIEEEPKKKAAAGSKKKKVVVKKAKKVKKVKVSKKKAGGKAKRIAAKKRHGGRMRRMRRARGTKKGGGKH